MQTFIKIGTVVLSYLADKQTNRQTDKRQAKYNQEVITNIRNFYHRG